MKLTLYMGYMSPFVGRVMIMAYAKNIALELRPTPRHGVKLPKFLPLTPIGKVPLLVIDDGIALPESEAICEYLEDAFPEPSLRPADLVKRAQARSLARILDFYVAMPVVSRVLKQMNAKERDEKELDEAYAEVTKGLGYVEHYLKGPTYAVGGQLTVADCALVPWFFSYFDQVLPRTLGRPSLLTPKLKVYLGEVTKKDPHVARAMADMQVLVDSRIAQISANRI